MYSMEMTKEEYIKVMLRPTVLIAFPNIADVYYKALLDDEWCTIEDTHGRKANIDITQCSFREIFSETAKTLDKYFLAEG